MHGLTVAGHLFFAWSIGVAATTIFSDLGPGFLRDHPPVERRIAGALVGPLAFLSLAALAAGGSGRLSLLIAAPYFLSAALYSFAWVRRWRAPQRRPLGWQTGVIGAFALLVLMLTAGPQDWHSGTTMAAYAASAGLLGGLTCLVLKAALGAHAADVEDTSSPYGIAARTVAFGMGICALAAFEVLVWLAGHRDWAPTLGLWLGASLVMPGLLMGLGHKLYPRLQTLVWALALASALGGQATIHTVTLFFPGLIPPAVL
ncbi:MAG TPA: hypothetical protein VNT75_03140 [Symbiobacteriaceae bacterium]|nr:hypothetical protein [Symbiobacteriaceae bacterium]